MKFLLFGALSLFTLFASANELNSPQPHSSRNETPPAVEYNYSQKLDIAKVISLYSATSNRCEPVEAHMIYLDHQGVRHNLEYMRLSEICASS